MSAQDRVQQLADAVRVHLQYRAAGGGDPAPWLQRHPELEELLAPMLQGDGEPDAAVEPAGSGAVLPRRFGDYELLAQLGRGGMGVVFEAIQLSLGRRVAVKVLSSALALHERSLWRFQREARLLAQLEHPGIVKVFDAGAIDGVPFYAMELVDGAALSTVIDAVRRHGLQTATGDTVRAAVVGASSPSAASAWQPDADYARAVVAIVLQVAAALACAHAAGIVHRDVKPANVLLRADGVALLSDFGIARHDQGPALTLTGDFAGTPHYASPEQARGGALDHRSDVFSLGVTLYELLTLRRPFDGETTAGVLAAVERRQPEDPARLHPGLSRDLAAVVGKALEKEPARRYQSAGEFAADLRACLEHRPVTAQRPSPWGRLLRWARREPLRAALLGTVGAALLTIAVVSFVLTRQLLQKGAEATQALADYERLGLGVRLESARRAAEGFRPARAERIADMEAWLQTEAAPLLAALAPLRRQLAALRQRALPCSAADAAADAASHPRAEELELVRREVVDMRRYSEGKVPGRKPKPEMAPVLAGLEARLAALRAEVETRRTFRFARDEDRFLHDELASLVAALALSCESETGELAFVREQLQWAKLSRQRCMVDGGPAWQQAIAAVAASPLYGGLRLRPQTDLVPIGADPATGLQEFVHLRSGTDGKAIPQRGADGRLVITDDTGIVFVLLPGGKATMGAQRLDKSAPHYDELAEDDESPVHGLELAPFLIGKYETTQAQWAALAGGERPSLYQPGTRTVQPFVLTAHNPVENVSWHQAQAVLGGQGLCLPTEAQWEHACRAGSSTPWSFGADAGGFGSFGNIADRSVTAATNWGAEPGVRDGFVVHAPVGSFQPNAFGLFDMHGNVSEWCQDVAVRYNRPVAAADGLRQRRIADAIVRVLRGGSYRWLAAVARSGDRFAKEPDYRDSEVGVRAARMIEP